MCTKMDGGESRFNVPSVVEGQKSQMEQCPSTTTFEEKREPKRTRTEVRPLARLAVYRWARAAHVGAALGQS